MTPGDVTRDAFLTGRLHILQPAKGYRAGLDALLLAAGVEAPAGGTVLEAGCGVGAALLAFALRAKDVACVGVEREPGMVDLARRNVAANGFGGRVEIVEADALRDAPRGPFEGAFCNPPYAQTGEGGAPRADRRHAYWTEAPLERWVAALADRLSGGAALTLIHRAERVPEILAAFEGRLGGVELMPIRPRAGQPAHRALVRGRKGSRAPFRLLAGFDVHAPDGFTPAARAAIEDGAALEW